MSLATSPSAGSAARNAVSENSSPSRKSTGTVAMQVTATTDEASTESPEGNAPPRAHPAGWCIGSRHRAPGLADQSSRQRRANADPPPGTGGRAVTETAPSANAHAGIASDGWVPRVSTSSVGR